jgi:uncharacterized protein DUF6763
MSFDLEPAVGSWYRRADPEQWFTVLGIDEDEELIELQHQDGETEEISFAAWHEMDLETAEEPEDWPGPRDKSEDDDEDDEDEEDDDFDEDEDDDWGGDDEDDRD